MKPFDLDAAKRGEPIFLEAQHTGLNYRGTVFFVGVSGNDLPVVEIDSKPIRISPEYLRMAPKKRTVWLNFWKDNGLKCTVFESEDGAKGTPGYHPWTHIAVPIEIED
jgi:hypothetical protein